MTTDGKKYYYISYSSDSDDFGHLMELHTTIGTCDEYDSDGPYFNEQGGEIGVFSVETFDEVKKWLAEGGVKWNGAEFELNYSGLCDADRKTLDEYVASLTHEEDERSQFDTDFATDADYADGFIESDGARLERESGIPDPVDDEYDEPDGDEDTDDKEME